MNFKELTTLDFDNENFRKELKEELEEYFSIYSKDRNILFLNNIPTDVLNRELGFVFEEETQAKEIEFTYNNQDFVYRKNVYMNTSTITRR